MRRDKDTILSAIYYSKDWLETLLEAHYHTTEYKENVKKWKSDLKKIVALEKKLKEEL